LLIIAVLVFFGTIFRYFSLSPIISANTIGFHCGKHHKVYVADLNKLVTGTKFADLPLVKIISETTGKADKTIIFNTAAQTCKHTFYSIFHQIIDIQ